MATELTMQQAEKMKEECKAKIELDNALLRLEANPDFKRLCEHYLEEEPARLVNLLADPNINLGSQKAVNREELQERMIGIARFSEYLRNIRLLAERANKTLEDLSQAEIVKE